MLLVRQALKPLIKINHMQIIVNPKIQVLWDATPWQLVNSYEHFRGCSALRLQGQEVK
jgi:hypothetical protein